jgi:transcriptional regulator with XRE-family HTH domain
MNTFQYIRYKLKELRELRRITQKCVADYMGVCQNTVSRWETGSYKPSIDELEKLSKFYGVSILYFFPEDPEYSSEKIKSIFQIIADLSDSDSAAIRKFAEFLRFKRDDNI